MEKLKDVFERFESKYYIGSSAYKGDKIDFTYKNSFNSWSHSVSIKVIDNKMYFQTYRIDPHKDLLPYKFTEYAHNQIGCIIPINKVDLIHKVMTVYDRFKLNY